MAKGEPSKENLAQTALIFQSLKEPVIQSVLASLQLPVSSHGLDAGCGIGLQALLLSKAVGRHGRVIGLDMNPDLVACAKDLANDAGLSEQLSFQAGDIGNLSFADDSFDWAWSTDCVGYAPMEPLPLLKELARVVRPGGTVTILAWSSEKLLPGYPVLEARLNGTSSGIAPFSAEKQPELHFPRALGWFQAAGLTAIAAKTFVGDAYAPLKDDIRAALKTLFTMRWPGVESELSPEIRREYSRLCIPESQDFVLNRPDYYAYFTYSMFTGRVAE